MSGESKKFTVKLDIKKLREALEMLEEGIEFRGCVEYINSIKYNYEDDEIRISDDINGDWFDVPIEYVPVLARELLKAYFNVIEQYREKLKKLESGVWEV